MRWIRSLTLSLVFLVTPVVYGQGLWEKETFQQLCKRLEPVAPERMAAAVGAAVAARDGLDAAHLKDIRFESMRPLLQRAAENGWGILQLFTQREFADPKGCALFLDGATLAEIHRTFNLHGVWQIAAKVAGGNGEILPMSYMIVGRGRLIVGYPRRATVMIDDGDAVTGEYDYAPYFSARIQGEPAVPGLVDIRTLTSPDGDFEPFFGPYGVKIRALQMAGRSILVKYAWGIEQERLARAVPISLRDRVAVSP